MGAGEQILERVITYVVDPAIRVVFTLGLFLFIWGIVEFMWGLKEGRASDEGKKHMVYGLIGMLIMVSVYGIISVIVNTFKLNISSTDVSRIENVQLGKPFE